MKEHDINIFFVFIMGIIEEDSDYFQCVLSPSHSYILWSQFVHGCLINYTKLCINCIYFLKICPTIYYKSLSLDSTNFINILQLVTLSYDKLTLAVIVREDDKEKIISILRVLICRCPAILCRPGNNSYLSCSLLLARKSVKIFHFTFYNYIWQTAGDFLNNFCEFENFL